MKISSILDAVEFVLKETHEPDTPYWLASQMKEMQLWRASQHDVRAELEMDIAKLGEGSRFVKMSDDQYGLRSWTRT